MTNPTPEEKLLARAERAEAIDPRWRPMRTAPRDGTPIEVGVNEWRAIVCHSQNDSGYGGWLWIQGGEGTQSLHKWRWRPCHPEWQEESG